MSVHSAAGLDFKTVGEGPPLLLVMGMSGTYDHWDQRFVELLARRRTVILYDHRGVGRSKPAQDPFTIADLAEDAVALLDELGAQEADLLGFSMGGMIAQELALRHPDRLRRLVLAGTFAGGSRSLPTPQETVELLGEALQSGDRERALRTAWQLNISPKRQEDRELLERFLAVGRKRIVPLAVIQLQMEAILQFDTYDRLPAITAPTLVLHGTADRMLPYGNGEILASRIPNARLELLEGVGHLFCWEEPDRSAGLVLDHLEGEDT